MLNRDYRYDFFRALAMVVITLNHARYPAGTDFKIQPTPSLDGLDIFLFISGSVCGLAYFRRFSEGGWLAAQKRALRRVGQLYVANLLTLLLCLAGMAMLGLDITGPPHWETRFAPFLDEPIKAWAKVILAIQTPNFFIVLFLYCGFLLMMPTMIWLYARKRLVAVGLSLMMWLMMLWVEAFSRDYALPIRILFWKVPVFGEVLLWQVQFMTGLWIGIEYRRGTLNLPRGKAWLVAAITLLAALFTLHRLAGFDMLPRLVAELLHAAGSKEWNGPLRMVEILLAAYIIARLMPREHPLYHARWLQPWWSFSRWSMTAYCVSMFYAYVPVAYLAKIHPDITALQLAAVSLVWVGLTIVVIHLIDRWRFPHRHAPPHETEETNTSRV